MPIYEFLCPACNRVFSFLVKSASEQREPACPKCGGKDMRRRISQFALTGSSRKSKDKVAAAADGEGAGAADAPAGHDSSDDPRVEREMMALMSAAENLDEKDPRQLGRLMRRLTEITGEAVEPQMEEAMRRLEAGEDPEKIDEDLGDLLGDDAGEGGGQSGPTVDPGLYDL